MPDKPFVINDRRKFTADGELRQDAPASSHAEAREPVPQPKPSAGPQLVGTQASAAPPSAEPAPAEPAEPQTGPDLGADELAGEDELAQADQIPAPTAEQTDAVNRAYDATIDRLDTALRAQNLGADRPPPVTFSAVVQTLFMQALMMLGGAAEPGQPVSVDPMGARQVIDMIGVVVEKAKGNLTAEEDKFCQSVLFELRMGFLEITQRLARQAASKAAPVPGAPSGPNLVR